MRKIVVIAHDMRSAHNVGSLLRTAEGLGVTKVYLTGYTPYPLHDKDDRLPHIAQKLHKQISKTALGAESQNIWQHTADVHTVIHDLKAEGFTVAALEQTTDAVKLHTLQVSNKIAILLGREVEGVDPALLELCDTSIEIPMYGQKESFNVVQAAAMALYHCRFS